jgi:hypothetical protein
MENGIRVLPEPQAISVAEENIADFSLPAEVFSYAPPPDIVNCRFKNGDVERKIYCNIELTEKELEELRELQAKVKEANLQFFPSIGVMAARYLSRARGDVAKAVKLMKETQEWRQEYFRSGPVDDKAMWDDLLQGIIYFCGRDKDLRPTIVVRPQRIPQQWYKDKRTDKIIRVLIFCMEYMIRYMIVPGKVENNCVIVDLRDVSLGLQSGSQLKEIYSVMSHHYIGRVFRFYICNLTPTLKRIGGWITNILTDRQKQKLNFVDDVSDLRKDFHANQLEEDLGGTRPLEKVVFPFPLQGGPFQPATDGGGDAGATESVKGGHRLLTADGARGRLWDKTRTREDNFALDFTPEAYGLLSKSDLPVPPEVLRAHVLGRATATNGHGESVSTATTDDNVKAEPSPTAESEVTCIFPPASDGSKEGLGAFGGPLIIPETEDTMRCTDDLTDGAIKTGGIFSCNPCGTAL